MNDRRQRNKWLVYAAAAAVTAAATYGEAAKTDFSPKGIAFWMMATLVGGVFWGLVGNWILDRRRRLDKR